MKPIERVVATLQHKQPDRVPAYPILSGVTRKLTGVSYKTWSTNADECAKAIIAATEKFELDVICTLIDLSVEAADFGQELDYPENEAAHPNFNNHMIKDLDDYENIPRINPRTSSRMSMHIETCRQLAEKKGSEVPVVAFVFGPLGILSMLRGQQDLYMDLYDAPDLVHKALDLITDVLIEYCDALMESGVHAIMLDTLFASKTIMSKDMWVEFESAYCKRIADYVHGKGCMVMIHNCGGGIYFDVQIESMKPEAISFLHVPDDCIDMADCKEKYGHITTLIGCVPPTWLPSASHDVVISECKKTIDTFKKDGGFILATGCEYPANLSFDHAETMVNVCKEYGKY